MTNIVILWCLTNTTEMTKAPRRSKQRIPTLEKKKRAIDFQYWTEINSLVIAPVSGIFFF